MPNALRSGESFITGAEVTYTCNAGFVITGTSINSIRVVCQANGQWTPLPTCSRVVPPGIQTFLFQHHCSTLMQFIINVAAYSTRCEKVGSDADGAFFALTMSLQSALALKQQIKCLPIVFQIRNFSHAL